MKLLLVDNVHIYKTGDGEYYSPTIYNNEFFKRYLNVFSEVRLVCKVKHVNKTYVSNFIKITIPNLEFYEIPWYQGLKSMMSQLFLLDNIYKKASSGCNCIIYRVAQIESFWVFLRSHNPGLPFALEIVNDPRSFTSMNILLRLFSIFLLKTMCKRADGISYVTRYYLQNLYKPKINSNLKFSSFYSSVELSENDFYRARSYNKMNEIKICHVSNYISDNTKGQFTLLKSVKMMKEKGLNVSIHIIGDGPYLKKLKKYCSKSNISSQVFFYGRFSNRQVLFEKLKEMDIMVYPSKMEGLPRVLIEAMAVGLPIISTPIAGIPELINTKYLINPNDFRSIAKIVNRLAINPIELEQMSKSNYEKAMEYTNTVLEPKRTNFYTSLMILGE